MRLLLGLLILVFAGCNSLSDPKHAYSCGPTSIWYLPGNSMDHKQISRDILDHAYFLDSLFREIVGLWGDGTKPTMPGEIRSFLTRNGFEFKAMSGTDEELRKAMSDHVKSGGHGIVLLRRWWPIMYHYSYFDAHNNSWSKLNSDIEVVWVFFISIDKNP